MFIRPISPLRQKNSTNNVINKAVPARNNRKRWLIGVSLLINKHNVQNINGTAIHATHTFIAENATIIPTKNTATVINYKLINKT